MTFRASFYNAKLIRANLKHNRHIMIVETIAMFLASSLIIILLHAQRGGKVYTLPIRYIFSFQGLNVFSIILMAIFPVTIACFGQSYLYQKRSVSFYHSMPYTRTQLYISNYLSGFFTYVIPLTIIFLCNTVIYFALGMGQEFSYIILVQGLFISILFYSILYSVAVFSAILSGNIIAQIFMIIFVFCIVPSTEGIVQFCIACWYDKIPFQEFRTLVPSFPMLYLKTILSSRTFFLSDILYCVGYALAFAVAGALCYRLRKSEDCNKFYVFVPIKCIVKYCVSFLAAVLLGVVFQQMAYNHHILFMVLGFVIGGYLSYAIIQSIYEKSFRSMFSNMKSFVPFCVVTCLIMLCISADLFHLNDYIPNQQSITAIGLSRNDESSSGEIVFHDKKNMNKLYRLAQKTRNVSPDDAYDDVVFHYHTNTIFGKIKRISYMDKTVFDEMMESVYDSKEYKTQYANIAGLTPSMKKIVEVDLAKTEYLKIFNAKESTNITREQTYQLLIILQKDIQNHTYADIKNSYPYISVSITSHSHGLDNKQITFVVYSCYNNTISYIRSHYPLTKQQQKPKSITISVESIAKGNDTNATKTITINGAAFMNELLEKSYNGISDIYERNNTFTVGEHQYRQYLSAQTSENSYFNVSYHVLSKELQQEIMRQLSEKQ